MEGPETIVRSGEENPSESIFDLLAKIRKRPAMYLGKPSIHHLRCYLDGWLHGNPNGLQEAQSFSHFVTWVEKRYKMEFTQSWTKIIDFWSVDEIRALDHFFTLLDEFQQKNSAGLNLPHF